jgi:hypothetical protein
VAFINNGKMVSDTEMKIGMCHLTCFASVTEEVIIAIAKEMHGFFHICLYLTFVCGIADVGPVALNVHM